jgi:exopolysaccharide biosynthesis polyprenyl glycosylphosphotransferase
MEGMPLLTMPRPRLMRSSLRLKRALDLVVGTAALVFLAPVLAACAIAIKLDSPGPVFFRQRRVGRDDRPFQVFKFRSMYVDADRRKDDVARLNFHGGGNDQGMFKIRDDPRITRVGRFLRRYSLDELPQLFNILRGEMSFVGPRPLIETEDRQIEGRFRRRLSLTPGLTGLWQAHGRSDIPFEQMVNLDYLYVTNWSLWGDVKLVMRTASAVFRGSGAY